MGRRGQWWEGGDSDGKEGTMVGRRDSGGKREEWWEEGRMMRRGQ